MRVPKEYRYPPPHHHHHHHHPSPIDVEIFWTCKSFEMILKILSEQWNMYSNGKTFESLVWIEISRNQKEKGCNSYIMFCNESELLELDRLKIKNVQGDAIILFLASYFLTFNTLLYHAVIAYWLCWTPSNLATRVRFPGEASFFFLNYASVRKSY